MLAAATKSFVRITGAAGSRRAPLLSAQACFLSTEAAAPATPAAEKPKRTKLKIPTKRAASLLQQLEAEAVTKASEGKDIDNFKPGDSVEVQYLLSRTSSRVQRVKGVVLARRNRGTGSSFVIRNHIGGYGYEQKIFLHSPLLKSVKVLQEAFIHKGKKRVRRAKLFYLREKAPSFTTV
ncbi:mitochondrial 54S ribosomal protein YmL19 [Phytophthora pseudosyringae]|uniref:Mitochondrial 54S ribosomal protein YmL19 n=1 Tax=Phytophthora pseudosyringae TaxID=221518 RepID=A0A8T1WL17_9STRA|nr:mitochondrial 54S ribosomal protein YmL19 [Phytophthora pseudosyringae]